MTVYTAITFAPVQGFIEKSRKLRDLYGSSFILSYLANQICQAARETFGEDPDPVVSPALIKVAQGTPNQIIIRGKFPEIRAKEILNSAWKKITDGCRQWIEDNIKQADGQPFDYTWRSHWNAWTNHSWEFFWAQGNTITKARENLNEKKRSRNWIGINWSGESSTLSGADGVAWYGMATFNPKLDSMGETEAKIEKFYEQLSRKLTESIISTREQLSIPELIKRLVIVYPVATAIGIDPKELPKSFVDLNRHLDEKNEEDDVEINPDEDNEPRYSGWFQGDGDKAGDFLKNLNGTPEEESRTHEFSLAMREWGEKLDSHLPKSFRDREAPRTSKINPYDGRIIYAGGDDFLGVLYRNPPEPKLTAFECIQWFYKFKSADAQNSIWDLHRQPISVSVGFVWAAGGVPQREILQHCRQAEKSAKTKGRDRLAIRVLFNSSNYLEWVCPWWFLNVLDDYRDREKKTGKNANWSHIYEDVAYLESRHALQNEVDLALELFKVYFPNQYGILAKSKNWCEHDTNAGKRTGILAAENVLDLDLDLLLNQWIVNLAKVGFYLCR
jgi:CRISPR-associated protein Cmr2